MAAAGDPQDAGRNWSVTAMRLPIVQLALVVVALPVTHQALAQSQTELNRQSYEDYQKADKRLNATYTALMAKISDAGKARLREAQVSWLRFRDQECIFEAMGTEGGSVHPLIVNECLGRLTLARVKDLERQLNCQEGDLSCARQ
jgi:uncharacterized protein YecT (DUF1311 family)